MLSITVMDVLSNWSSLMRYLVLRDGSELFLKYPLDYMHYLSVANFPKWGRPITQCQHGQINSEILDYIFKSLPPHELRWILWLCWRESCCLSFKSYQHKVWALMYAVSFWRGAQPHQDSQTLQFFFVLPLDKYSPSFGLFPLTLHLGENIDFSSADEDSPDIILA